MASAGDSDDEPLSKRAPAGKKAKAKTDEADSDDEPLATKKTAAKKEAKPKKEKKAAAAAAEDSDDEKGSKKKPKKFDKPGQRKETPPELDVLRMFYESWHTEMPDAELPEKWCYVHGVFDKHKQQEIFDRGGGSSSSSHHSTDRKHKPEPKKKVTAKKEVKDDDSDDDVPLAKKVNTKAKAEKPVAHAVQIGYPGMHPPSAALLSTPAIVVPSLPPNGGPFNGMAGPYPPQQFVVGMFPHHPHPHAHPHMGQQMHPIPVGGPAPMMGPGGVIYGPPPHMHPHMGHPVLVHGHAPHGQPMPLQVPVAHMHPHPHQFAPAPPQAQVAPMVTSRGADDDEDVPLAKRLAVKK